MVIRNAVTPKKQVNPIVKIQPTNATGTSKGVGQPTGQATFTEVQPQDSTQHGVPIKQVSISNQGVVQPTAGGGINDVSQLTPEQQTQLGIGNQNNSILTPILNDLNNVLGGGGVNVPPSTENANNAFIPTGNNQINRSVGQPQLISQQQDTRNAFEKFVNFPKAPNEAINPLTATPQQISAQTAGVAFGLAGGEALFRAAQGIAANVAVKAALNTPAEAANIVSNVVPATTQTALRGAAPEVGQLATNTKVAGLIAGLATNSWKILGTSLAGLAVIGAVFNNGFDNYRYQTSLNNINDAIKQNSNAIANENIPIIQEAYQQQNEVLLQLQKEVANPKGIDGLEMNLPVINKLSVNKLRAASAEALREYELNTVRIAQQRKDILQSKANIIGSLSPEERQAIIDYANARKQDVSAATTLTEVQ